MWALFHPGYSRHPAPRMGMANKICILLTCQDCYWLRPAVRQIVIAAEPEAAARTYAPAPSLRQLETTLASSRRPP